MNTPDWRRPTQAESALGFIAMQKQVFYCQAPDKAWKGGKLLMCVETDSKGQARYLGYTSAMIERRISWGGSLPYWITINRQEKLAA